MRMYVYIDIIVYIGIIVYISIIVCQWFAKEKVSNQDTCMCT